MTEQWLRPGKKLTVRDVLCYPFVLRSQSVETAAGAWHRKVSYPELGCEVSGENLEQALDELDCEKFQVILRNLPMLGFVPEREPVPDPSIEQQLDRLGVTDLIPHLDDELQAYPAPASGGTEPKVRAGWRS
jgi:hypothetical protein